MPSGKDRLYIALHARSGAPKMPDGEDKSIFLRPRLKLNLNVDRYHWSFIIGPKNESESATGRRCHAKERMQDVAAEFQHTWEFENLQKSLLPAAAILVRIIISKVTDEARLREIFAKTPIRAGSQGYEGWNCVSWAQEALSCAARDGKTLGSGNVDWVYVKDTALWYVAKKAAEHRFDGQREFDQGKVATWDAIEGKELMA